MKARHLAFLLLFCAGSATAQWKLDNGESRLSFVSIKKGDVAEVHRFKDLSGTVNNRGAVDLTIDLGSVDTAVPVRDERMRTMLFDTAKFPTARLSAQVDPELIKALRPGELMMTTVDAQLTLHGVSKPLEANLAIARLGGDRILVISAKPVLINARDFELAAGVEKLREVVNLPSISLAVPVSFVLTFQAAEPAPQ